MDTNGGTNLLEDSSQILLGMNFYTAGFVGLMDDLQIYHIVLSTNEIAYLFHTPESVITNFSSPELAVGSGDTNLAWFSSGDNPWFQETTNTFGASVALQSGEVSYNQMSLPTTVTGPGTLTFQWATLAGDTSFNLVFFEDGSTNGVTSGDTPWQSQGPFDIAGGSACIDVDGFCQRLDQHHQRGVCE